MNPSRILRGICAALILALTAAPTLATDAIGRGMVSSVTWRANYVMFAVVSSGPGPAANLCAPCPADPSNLASGGFCWISVTETTAIQMLLLARTNNKYINGRVVSLTTDCTMYQLQILDF